MKNYQNLIGLLLVAISIVIAGILISNSIDHGFSGLLSSVNNLGTLIRDGLIQSP